MDFDAKLNRYMRKAKQKTSVDSVQAKLEQVQNMLSSDAVQTLLANGDLTRETFVDTLKTLVSVAASGDMDTLPRAQRCKLEDAFSSSTRLRSPDLRHFAPFGPTQVAEAVEEIRLLHNTIADFESAFVAARRSASTVVNDSQNLATQLIYKLENGVTPND